jgi:hypothetical protein
MEEKIEELRDESVRLRIDRFMRECYRLMDLNFLVNPYDSYEVNDRILDAEDCVREIFACMMRARKEVIIAYNVAYDIYNRNRG